MAKICPVCKKEMHNESEKLCPQCGWEFKSSRGKVSEEERALQAKKLAIAIINNWEALHTYAQEARKKAGESGTERTKAPSRQEKEVPAAEPYTESTPLPALEKDCFEYPQEFKARLEAHQPVVAGTAQFVKEDYNLSAAIFPLTLTWKEWARPLLTPPLASSSARIPADRDLARSICETGSTRPVFAKLTALEDGKPSISKLELLISGNPIPIEFESGVEGSTRGGIWREPVTGMEFVRVEGGCYQMGCGEWDAEGYAHEKPVHEVFLDGFWMGIYPVTQGQWQRVMGSNPSCFKLGERYPVESVSWLEAKQFISKLAKMNEGLFGFRLPTEAEWEYACRSGGRPEKYAGGIELERAAWYDANSGGTSHPVGEKEPNGLGLYDMSGNVWEWCEDIYCDTAYSRHERNNPFWSTGEPDRVIRGGSWYAGPRYARCSDRGFNDQTYRRHYVGFRVLRVR